MNGEKQVGTTLVRDCRPPFERNETIVIAGENNFRPDRLLHHRGEALGHIQHEFFFLEAGGAGGSLIPAPVARIDYHAPDLQPQRARHGIPRFPVLGRRGNRFFNWTFFIQASGRRNDRPGRILRARNADRLFRYGPFFGADGGWGGGLDPARLRLGLHEFRRRLEGLRRSGWNRDGRSVFAPEFDHEPLGARKLGIHELHIGHGQIQNNTRIELSVGRDANLFD